MNPEAEDRQFLDRYDMVIGPEATKIVINKRRDDPDMMKFRIKVSAAYVSTRCDDLDQSLSYIRLHTL